MTNTTTYTFLRENLKTILDKIIDRREPYRISRRNGGDVVIISAEDYESLEETAYLLKSPKNATRLFEALNRKGGKTLKDVENELNI